MAMGGRGKTRWKGKACSQLLHRGWRTKRVKREKRLEGFGSERDKEDM